MRSDPCAVSPAYNIRPELIEYTARVYTRYGASLCELTNTGLRYTGGGKIKNSSEIARTTAYLVPAKPYAFV